MAKATGQGTLATVTPGWGVHIWPCWGLQEEGNPGTPVHQGLCRQKDHQRPESLPQTQLRAGRAGPEAGKRAGRVCESQVRLLPDPK